MQTLLQIESLHCIQMALLLNLQAFVQVLHAIEHPQPKISQNKNVSQVNGLSAMQSRNIQRNISTLIDTGLE